MQSTCNPKRPLLEVISTSPCDSISIQKGGADRIQLVSALQIGGLTPSHAMIRKCLQCVDIPTMVMIRHRHAGGFTHTKQQIDLLCQEIEVCVKDIGVKGIVIGGLVENQKMEMEIDSNFIKNAIQAQSKSLEQRANIKFQEETQKIAKTISSLSHLTFHKAFDQTSNIVNSYDEMSELGVQRILTQGGPSLVTNNYSVLREIIKKSVTVPTNHQQSLARPKVLIGGGINFQNVKKIIKETGTQEIHIGTCVRQNKYGNVQQKLVQQFIQKMNE